MHVLAVVKRDQEWPHAAVFVVHNEASEDDRYTRNASRNGWWHEPEKKNQLKFGGGDLTTSYLEALT
jgi:hypothetical protein